MIEVNHLTAGYPGCPVFQDITLKLRPREVTVLLGPNGCGKSTLLKTILGLHKNTGGEILLDGNPMEQLSARQIALKTAYLAQSRNTPNITAYRMVLHGRFPYLSYPRRYRKEDHLAAQAALQFADAANLADTPVTQLSGGQRQKVYLAMVLAQNTDTIFMDEPTTYLDVQHQLDVMRLSRKLAAQGKAVVLVLHDLCLAMRTADHIVVMADGKIQQEGKPDEIFESGILNCVFHISLRRVESDCGWQYYYMEADDR